MSPDPEAAWPLTTTEPGYYPGQAPTATPLPQAMPPYQTMTPLNPTASSTTRSLSPKPMSHGLRLGFLAIILGAAIPLTAIALDLGGFPALIVVWAGLVMVTAFTLSNTGK